MNSRQLNKLFNQARKDANRERKNAVNTLSPQQIERGIKAGKLPPGNQVLAGANSDGLPFSIEDLKAFKAANKRASKKFGDKSGAPISQLVAASRPIDIQRSNRDIRLATLYGITKTGECSFKVTASPQSDKSHHQVKIRLEGWQTAISAPSNAVLTTRNLINGNVSFDCGCGRHQFWYRYIATVGNFAIRPLEKDFPKIRNPNLTGCCCKHTLKAMATIKSPTVQRRIASELERQRKKDGFAEGKLFSKKELAEMERARPRKIDQAKFSKEAQKLERIQKGMRKIMKDPRVIEKSERLKREARAKNAQIKRQEAKINKLEGALKSRAKTAVKYAMMAVNAGAVKRADVVGGIAKEYGLTKSQIESLIKENG